MMITFSTSCAMEGVRSPRGIFYFTLYSSSPPVDRPPQLEVGDDPRDQGKPEGEGPEDEHGDDRQPRVDVEGDERSDHPTLHPADAARQRQQVAEHPDEEGLDQHGPRGGGAERAERRPQHEDLERPEEDRADEREVARADVL